MKNQNAIAQIAYIVTADYYTNGKPTTCKITVFWDDTRAGGSNARSLSVEAQI